MTAAARGPYQAIRSNPAGNDHLHSDAGNVGQRPLAGGVADVDQDIASAEHRVVDVAIRLGLGQRAATSTRTAPGASRLLLTLSDPRNAARLAPDGAAAGICVAAGRCRSRARQNSGRGPLFDRSFHIPVLHRPDCALLLIEDGLEPFAGEHE